uniref:Putative secreted protein n=1 Tax=Anopheles darlingi TaxID=43151 RepID=A0A2M4D0S2_ANODA
MKARPPMSFISAVIVASSFASSRLRQCSTVSDSFQRTSVPCNRIASLVWFFCSANLCSACALSLASIVPRASEQLKPSAAFLVIWYNRSFWRDR